MPTGEDYNTDADDHFDEHAGLLRDIRIAHKRAIQERRKHYRKEPPDGSEEWNTWADELSDLDRECAALIADALNERTPRVRIRKSLGSNATDIWNRYTVLITKHENWWMLKTEVPPPKSTYEEGLQWL